MVTDRAHRNNRIGIDDTWYRAQKTDDGSMVKVPTALHGNKTKARWRVRWVIDGKERSKSFRRKPDAERFVSGLTADVERGEYVSREKSGETFGAVANEWLAGREIACKAKTVAGYRSLLETLILPRWKDVRLRDITHKEVQQWITGLRAAGSVKREGKGLSASRVIQAHQCLSSVLKYAIRTDRLAKNVANGIDLPRKVEAERIYLSHAQLLTLAAHAGRFEVLTLVMGYCGLRIGEATALRGRDVSDKRINVSGNITYVTGTGYDEDDTKTGTVRWVPVPEFVWDKLKDELPADPEAFVFAGRHSQGHITVGEYRTVFDKARLLAGAPDATPHSLRHSCVSLAISCGANILAVQRLAGHTDIKMTLSKYGHLFSDDLVEVASALNTAALAASAA